MFSAFPMDITTLHNLTRKQRHKAFRPGTVSNHKSQFLLYIRFCQHYRLQDIDPTNDTVCMYATYLSKRFVSPQSVCNYMSAVRLLHKYLAIPAPALDSFDLKLTIRAIKLSMRHTPSQRRPLTVDMLRAMCTICDGLPASIGKMLKVALLFGFCGFLRQSNLAPRQAKQFDPTRHTCRGDVLIQPPGIVVIIKWTKTQQTTDKLTLLPIPAIPGSPLDPVVAYNEMIAAVPTRSDNDPLLLLPPTSRKRIVTTSLLQSCFRQLVAGVGGDPACFSLHSLRRGGATLAHHRGAHFLDIQRHGTWRSQAFLDYITTHGPADSPIPQVLATALLHS